MNILLAIGFAIAASGSTSTPARPKPIDRNAWIVSGDYPPAAARAAMEGRVAFRLDVNENGAATSCTVTASSGSALLDVHTCDLMRFRARFEPARDNSGRAIASEYSSEVEWEIPAGPSRDVSHDEPVDISTVEIEVGSNGRVTGCTVVQLAGSSSYEGTLDECAPYPVGFRYSNPTTRNEQPVGSRYQITHIETRVSDLP